MHMKNIETHEKYKSFLIKIIHKYLPNCKIYLFGSRARKTHRSGADIDLALDIEEKIHFKKLFEIQDKIEESNLPLFVDLVDLHSASEKLKNEVKNEGILWKS